MTTTMTAALVAMMCVGAVRAQKPNVVIIYGDDVGFGDVDRTDVFDAFLGALARIFRTSDVVGDLGHEGPLGQVQAADHLPDGVIPGDHLRRGAADP